MIRPVPDRVFHAAIGPSASPAAPAPASAAPASASADASGANTDEGIADAAKKMEGIFMSMLVDEMFKGTELTGDQSGYGSLITQQFGDALADAGGMGLASILTRQLKGASE